MRSRQSWSMAGRRGSGSGTSHLRRREKGQYPSWPTCGDGAGAWRRQDGGIRRTSVNELAAACNVDVFCGYSEVHRHEEGAPIFSESASSTPPFTVIAAECAKTFRRTCTCDERSARANRGAVVRCDSIDSSPCFSSVLPYDEANSRPSAPRHQSPCHDPATSWI